MKTISGFVGLMLAVSSVAGAAYANTPASCPAQLSEKLLDHFAASKRMDSIIAEPLRWKTPKEAFPNDPSVLSHMPLSKPLPDPLASQSESHHLLTPA